MRALYRTVAAIALGFPLVLAGSAVANADTPSDSGMSHHHKARHHKFKIDVDQDIKQTLHQRNSTDPFVVSGNNNKVVIKQENEGLQSTTQNAFSR